MRPEANSTVLEPDEEVEPCVYCGVPAESKDHVIPQSYASLMRDLLAPLDRTMKAFGYTVPACIECNSLLGNSALHTMTERRSLVKERLRKRHRQLLESPDWTDAELDELSGRLRDHIIEGQARKELLRARLRWPRRETK